jgi:hypothetical protein
VSTEAIFRKSTRSGNTGGNCVEVASNVPGQVFVRDSKDQTGPVLTFSPKAWTKFVAVIR